MAYVAPHLRRKLLAEQGIDAVKEQTERAEWGSLGRAIGNIINKINRNNFQVICTDELFIPNLIRGRGLFCKDVLHSCLDATSIAGATDLMPIYAALVAVVNSQLPNIGYMFCARTLDRYERRVRIDADKGNAEKALKLLCWLANFYVLDFVNIFYLIKTLLPTSALDFVEAVTNDATANTPKTTAMIQMCDLALVAFQTCAQLIKAEDQGTYQGIVDQFRDLYQELDAEMPRKQQHQRGSPAQTNPHLTKLFFSISNMMEEARTDFKSFSQYGDEEEEPQYDAKGRVIPPDPSIPPPPSLNLVPTETQFTHQFDLSDTAAIKASGESNSDWFKSDKDYELNEKRWAFIRDIILGKRDLIGEDGFDEDDEDAKAIKLDQIDENSPYAAAFSVQKLTDSLQLNPTTTDQNLNVGFGGNTDINKVAIDPEVEAVQIRKSIYLIFQQSVTADETVHRLLKTLSTQYKSIAERAKYIRHIALTLYDSMLARGVYNKDDGAIGRLLCGKNRDFVLEFEDLFALTCADIVNKKERETHILAVFFADMLSQQSISYSVFKYIELQVHRESLHDPIAISTRVFLTSLLKQIRKNLGEANLLKILTCSEYRQDTLQLFTFPTLKEYLAAAQFYKSAGLPLFETHVRTLQESASFQQTHNSSSSSDDDTTSSSSSSSSSDDSDSSDGGYRGRRYGGRRYSSDSDSDRGGSKSPPPRPYRRNNNNRSRSPSSDSRSPPPQSRFRRRYDSDSHSGSDRGRGSGRRDSSPPSRRRNYSSDDDDSRSPPPSSRRNRRLDFSDDSYSPPPPRRRDSRSPSPSPPPRNTNHDSTAGLPRDMFSDDAMPMLEDDGRDGSGGRGRGKGDSDDEKKSRVRSRPQYSDNSSGEDDRDKEFTARRRLNKDDDR